MRVFLFLLTLLGLVALAESQRKPSTGTVRLSVGAVYDVPYTFTGGPTTEVFRMYPKSGDDLIALSNKLGRVTPLAPPLTFTGRVSNVYLSPQYSSKAEFLEDMRTNAMVHLYGQPKKCLTDHATNTVNIDITDLFADDPKLRYKILVVCTNCFHSVGSITATKR